MCKICPKCGAIAEYNAYYGRTTCTSCNWESKKTVSASTLRTYKPTNRVSTFAAKQKRTAAKA